MAKASTFRGGKVLFIAACSLGAGSVVAAPPSISTVPQDIEAGAISIVPKFSLKTTYNSNFYKAENNEVDTWVTVAKPSVRLKTEDHNGFKYSLLLEHESTHATTDSADNEDKNKIRADVNLGLDIRNRLKLFAEYYDTFDARGDSWSELNPDTTQEPETWNKTTFSGKYTFGLPIANRISFWAKEVQTDYDSRRLASGADATAGRDRDDSTLGIGLYLKNSMLYDFLLELERTEVDYATADTLDSTVDRVWLGGNYALSGKSTGRFKLGRAWREYTQDVLEDVNNSVIWKVGVDWDPTSYSRLSFDTGSTVGETTGTGRDTQKTDYTLKYKHGFSDRLLGTLSYNVGESEYEGAAREDDREKAKLNFAFQARRWLTFGLGFTQDMRESNNEALDYRQNLVELKANMSL